MTLVLHVRVTRLYVRFVIGRIKIKDTSVGVLMKGTHIHKYMKFKICHSIEHKNSAIRTFLHEANTLKDNKYIREEIFMSLML